MAHYQIDDDRFRYLVVGSSRLDELYSGCRWAEGPVWVRGEFTGTFLRGDTPVPPAEGDVADYQRKHGILLFSDIPRNSVMRWDYGKGVSLFLKPSGYLSLIHI